MSLRDDERLEHIGIDILGVDVNVARALADALHRRLGDQLAQVGTAVAVRVLGDLGKVHVGAEAHLGVTSGGATSEG